MFVKAMDICYNLDDGVGGENDFMAFVGEFVLRTLLYDAKKASIIMVS